MHAQQIHIYTLAKKSKELIKMTIKEGKKNKVRLGFKVASLYKQLP
jgi:16S rRNA U516 pseudouridylate synthase RsuA-like enzyme